MTIFRSATVSGASVHIPFPEGKSAFPAKVCRQIIDETIKKCADAAKTCSA
jgi:hypothetical protein